MTFGSIDFELIFGNLEKVQLFFLETPPHLKLSATFFASLCGFCGISGVFSGSGGLRQKISFWIGRVFCESILKLQVMTLWQIQWSFFAAWSLVVLKNASN